MEISDSTLKTALSCVRIVINSPDITYSNSLNPENAFDELEAVIKSRESAEPEEDFDSWWAENAKGVL